jgi:DNA polymerase III delta subunit
MKAITLRNIPPELARIIRRKAAEKGMSFNKTIISLLMESLGIKERKKSLYHDLDALAGSWVKEEAREFEKYLAKQRSIDPDLWK